MDILLVDDNPINLKVLHDSLKDLNSRIYLASSGDDALGILEELTPSIIVLDIMMPIMDGFELCRKIKEQERLQYIPVIFITALNDNDNEMKALELGAVDFLTKPINPALVKARISNHLKLKYFQDSLEEKVVEKEEQFYSVVENAPDAIVLIKYHENRIVMANAAAERLFGKSRDELTNMSTLDLSPETQPDGVSSYYKSNKYLRESLDGGVHSFEWTHIGPDGSLVPCEVKLIKFPGDEPLLRASIVDITKRKEEEFNLKAAHGYINNIINSLPMVLIGLDKNLVITHWNSRAKEYSSIDDALGKKLIDVLPHIKLEIELILESIKSNKINRRNKRSRITDKGTIYENITIFPINSGAVLLIDDITDQVELQSMVIQSERMFSVGELASGVAHEITNPLAGIIQNGQSLINRLTKDLPGNIKAAKKYSLDLESLKLYLDDRKILKMIESIRSSGVRASHIIKNLNNFSKKDVGDLTYNDILPLIDQSLELATSDYNIEEDYDFKDIKVTRKIEENLPLVLCEPAKIVQAFLNIFRFSAKNIGKSHNSPKIEIEISVKDNSLFLYIRDNGEPLTPEECRILMLPYFKGRQTVREEWYSLSLSHFIIHEIHSGTFKITPIDGKGNEVSISIPIKI